MPNHAVALGDERARNRTMGETCALLLPFVRDGLPPIEIARALNLDRNSIASLISVYEIRTFKDVDAPFDPPVWRNIGDTDRKAWIAAGLKTGRSPGQVAVALTTHPKTMRKWCGDHDVSLAGEWSKGAGALVSLSSVAGFERKGRVDEVGTKANFKAARRYEASDAWDPVEGSEPVGLADAGSRHCRWPLWRAGDAVRPFCGARVEPGVSYCGVHRARAREGAA